MKSQIALAALIAAFAGTGCIPLKIAKEMGHNAVPGSGNMITKTIKVSDLKGLDAGGAFKVTITPDSAPLVVTLDDNLAELLIADVKKGILHLDFQSDITTKTTPTATVGIKTLESLELNGAVRVTALGVETALLNIEANGASRADLEGKVDQLEVSLDGAGMVELDASPKVVQAEGSGATSFTLNNLEPAERLNAELKGASKITVKSKVKVANLEFSGASSGTLDADEVRGSASGASSLTLRHEPTLKSFDVSGASKFSVGKE